MKWHISILGMTLALCAFLMGACGAQTVTQQADGNGINTPPNTIPVGVDGSYSPNYQLPAITVVYVISGTVEAAPASVTGYSMYGETHGSSGRYGGYVSGYISGSTEGKGIIRFTVDDVTYSDPYGKSGYVAQHPEEWTPIVKVDDVVMLKAEDRKAAGLAAGDHVIFMCREQWEWVMAVAQNEVPTTQSVTRELDGCRMIEPQITPAAQ